jgi:peptidoglycan/LPS O-acetylase OafA/YrhL
VLLVQRPDALVLGATAALARRRWGASWAAARSDRHSAAAVALATVALVVLMLVPASSRPGGPGVSLAAVAALMLVLGLVAHPDSAPARAYASRPMVAIGRISYGLYLWQQPVLRWVDDRLVGRSALIRVPIGISGALACAALSYRFVERPVLRWKERLGHTGQPRPETTLKDTLRPINQRATS